MRYESKQALVDDIRAEHDSLCALLAEIPKGRWNEAGVWGDGWTLSDLVAHLAEWQHLFLGWHQAGLRGAIPEMPAPGFKWSETPRLNRAIWAKHRARSYAEVRAEFDSGYTRILRIVEALSPQQLLASGQFAWTGKHPVATYVGPNTASHYRFAIKAIKRWLKGARRSVTAASILAIAVLAVGACDGQTPVLVQEIDGGSSTVTSSVDREIDITLGTVGPGAYDSIPTVSSTAVRFLDSSTVPPFVPAGPRQRFRFMPKQRGTAVITFHHSGTNPTVTTTVTVR